jgi:gliding motility-associated-like protein
VFIRVDSIRVEAGVGREILYGQVAQLQASGAPSFVWKLDPFLSCSRCPDPLVRPEVSTWYYVESEKPSACQNRDSVLISVRYDCEPVSFPTLFTPNGDEMNDRFDLNSILNANNCLLHFEEVVVYNRWGKEVFQSRDPDFGFPPVSIAAGVYFYRIHFRERIWHGWAQFSGDTVVH